MNIKWRNLSNPPPCLPHTWGDVMQQGSVTPRRLKFSRDYSKSHNYHFSPWPFHTSELVLFCPSPSLFFGTTHASSQAQSLFLRSLKACGWKQDNCSNKCAQQAVSKRSYLHCINPGTAAVHHYCHVGSRLVF